MDGVSAGNIRPNHWRSGIPEYARLYVDEGRGMGQKRRLLVRRERRHVGLQVLTSRAWGKPKQISGNFAKTFSSLFWSFAGFGIRKLPFPGVDKAIGLNPGLARVEFKIPPLVVE